MKKIFSRMSALFLILFLLASCTYPSFGGGGAPNPNPGTTPTLSDVQMQTQIPQLLTAMPTATGQPQEAVPTQSLPTVALQNPTQAGAAQAYPAATATETPAPAVATETLAPAATETPAPAEATATSDVNVGGGINPTGVVAATATANAPTSAVRTVAVTPPASATQRQPAGPTFTPDPNDPRARLGAPTSTDNMDRATTWVWPTGSDKFSEGEFGSGIQTITALTSTDAWRMANPLGREFSNLYLEATFKVAACAANDHYGLYVRVPVLHEPDQGYLVGFTCDGRYSLRRWDGKVPPKGQMKVLVDWKKSPAIAAGPNQVNRMGVMTVGSRLIIYANGKLLTEVQDTSYPNGYFGVFLGSRDTQNFTIQVDEMSYWENVQP